MRKVELEENEILESSLLLLKEIYGNFSIDKEQIDRPDKAIILEKNNAKIGIEITCIDNKDVLKYFNDEKITNKILNEQLSNIDGSYEYCENPVKKLSIPYPHTYIYDGVIKKEEKFSDYQKSDNYEEIIILAFTNYLKLENVKGIDYFTEWTQYLLSKEHFLFNKVILLCNETKKSFIVYDKDLGIPKSPPIINYKIESGITMARSSLIPVNKTVSIKNLFKKSPLVPKNDMNKSEKKKKRKEQRKSRKANR